MRLRSRLKTAQLNERIIPARFLQGRTLLPALVNGLERRSLEIQEHKVAFVGEGPASPRGSIR
jgi:hypothetical protein